MDEFEHAHKHAHKHAAKARGKSTIESTTKAPPRLFIYQRLANDKRNRCRWALACSLELVGDEEVAGYVKSTARASHATQCFLRSLTSPIISPRCYKPPGDPSSKLPLDQQLLPASPHSSKVPQKSNPSPKQSVEFIRRFSAT